MASVLGKILSNGISELLSAARVGRTGLPVRELSVLITDLEHVQAYCDQFTVPALDKAVEAMPRIEAEGVSSVPAKK